LLRSLVVIFHLPSWLGKGTNILILKPLHSVVKIFYQLFFKYPFLGFYQVLRRGKKLLGTEETPTSSWQLRKHFRNKTPSRDLLPLAGTLLISLIVTMISNNTAGAVKPENFGKNNLLNTVVAPIETFTETDAESTDEVTEGPLTSLPSSSYYSGLAMVPSNINVQPETIPNLVTTTKDETALVAPINADASLFGSKRRAVINYNILPGDTLGGIAKRFNISVNTILWANNLTAYSTIKPGQTLKILPTSGVAHQLKKGETLSAVAKLYGITDLDNILEFNGLITASDLKIGETLIIPGGVKKSAVVATKPKTTTTSKTSGGPAAKISATKFQWPTTSYRITQYYGWRHTGLDIGNKVGQPIYAAEDGQVITAGWNAGGYGNYVIINHNNGLQTLYGHQSKILVAKGQWVTRGQVIGLIGNTGRSTGPHLHYEVRVNGSRLNPLNYIR
jgi:murein DD-endopeptidase MepM/ murein hydrolase activator NlpD